MINCKVNRKLLIYCLRVSNLEEKDYCQLFCCVKGDVTFMTSTCQLSHAGAYCCDALCLTRLGREQNFCRNSSHICI
ncbi:hypothetical protein EJD97_014974 [Solanum chilense]|uniref:Uncharacterized protein n=1 Tax=Solanum chilense TaxID=4083 RepID=A0A6N2BAQ9_SOLCI|nr:hypothetical protein EJD97_014974 [Solanum chilense]